MNIIKIQAIFTLIFLYSESILASPLCQKEESQRSSCEQGVDHKPGQSPLKNLSSIDLYLWLESEAKIHQNIYRQKKDQFAHLFRYLEHGKLDDPKLEPASKKEWDDTKEDFNTLYQISKHIRVLEARLQICYQGNCSAGRRADYEHELMQIQKSKSLLLIKRPLLSHDSIEEFIKKQPLSFVDDDKAPSIEVARDLIKNASRETAKTLLEKVEKMDRYLNDPKAPLTHAKNQNYTAKYLQDLSSSHPEVADDLLNRFELIKPPSDKKDFLCALATKRQKERERDAFIKKGIETSLFIAPFALGPWGRAGVFGLEGALGAKLLRWGLTAKELESGAWIARGTFALGVNGYQSYETQKLGENCIRLEQKYFVSADAKKFQELADCKTEYQDNIFISSLGWITTLAPGIPAPALKFYRAKFTSQMTELSATSSQIGSQLKATPLAKNQWAFEFKTTDQGSFTYMDLSKIDRVSDQHMKNLPDDYWKFVGNIYSDRLNLTPDEIKGFIKSSQDFAPRTKLIVNTNGPIKEADNFKGGVGVVVSGKSDDLLPLEKAIGKKLERKPGEKSAEIVRLTVSKDADAEKLSKSLINQAAGVVLQDPTITTVYIYTSRIHKRLYSKLGVTPTSISQVSERDVLVTLKREDIERLLANTKN